jgi:hypothetical protein
MTPATPHATRVPGGRLAVIAAIMLGLAGVVGPAGSTASGQATSPKADVWACRPPSRILTVLFHDRGHDPIESLSFPAWHVPHVEFYWGSRPGTDTYLTYAGARGEGGIPPFSVNPSCALSDATAPFASAGSLRRVATATMLTCTFGRSGRFLTAKLGANSYRIQALLGSRVVVDSTVKSRGSFVRFAGGACKRSPVPT